MHHGIIFQHKTLMCYRPVRMVTTLNTLNSTGAQVSACIMKIRIEGHKVLLNSFIIQPTFSRNLRYLQLFKKSVFISKIQHL